MREANFNDLKGKTLKRVTGMEAIKLKDFREATKDMPDDAEIITEAYHIPLKVQEVIYNKEENLIVLC